MRRESFSPTQEDVQQPRKVRGKFLLWSGVAVLIGGAAVGMVYLVVVSGTLSASFVFPEMKLVSSAELFKELVAQRMAEHPFLRLLGADNILFWRGSEPVHLLAALSPVVADISTDVWLTGKRVSFTVSERPIIGVWCLLDAHAGESSGEGTTTTPHVETIARTCYGFDDDGVLFTVAPDISGALILKVTDENQEGRVLGQRVLPKQEWYERFSRTLRTVRENGGVVIAARVREAGLHEWEATLAEGVVLVFSFDFVPDDLGSVLRSLEERLKFESLSYIDFRIPNRIYYK
jgi:hypothetical protein